MTTNGTLEDIPVTSPSSMPPDEPQRAVETICIILAVLSLVTINVLLFLFWRYKALGKSPLIFKRYSSDCENYASLHQPVIRKGNTQSQTPSRVQEILRKYASTVASVGQAKARSKSTGSLCVSSSSGSRDSVVAPDADIKRSATSERKRCSEDKQGILANEQDTGRVDMEGEYDASSVKFKLGHPDEDSSRTGSLESDCQVYCEVMNFPSKRYARHFRPISTDCWDGKSETPGRQRSPNNNIITLQSSSDDSETSENIYENFRPRKATSPYASMAKSAAAAAAAAAAASPRKSTSPSYTTCKTISGDYATCDAAGEWRPTTFAFCRDVVSPTEKKLPTISDHVNDENPMYERFLEPNDPIYSQTVIRKSQHLIRVHPTPMARTTQLRPQPIYEQPSFEQPTSENLGNDGEPENDACINAEQMCPTQHLNIHAAGHAQLAASDSKLDVSSSTRASRKHSNGVRESRTVLTSQLSREDASMDIISRASRKHSNGVRESRTAFASQSSSEDAVIDLVPSSPQGAASDAKDNDESKSSPSKSAFHTIERDFAGFHEEYEDDYDPEETFPVMQMLSDRYSTGNFLNKFY